MTTQPELDLAYGLPACVPTQNLVEKDGSKSAHNTYSWNLEVNASACQPLKDGALFEAVPTSASVHRSSGRSNKFFIAVHLDEGKRFNPIENIAARRTYEIEGDQRLKQMRMALVNAALVAISNGAAQLPEGYTMSDLHNLKGFKWNLYAGCSCPCSPAYTTPLVPVLPCRKAVRSRYVRRGRYITDTYYTSSVANWMSVSFKVKEMQAIPTIVDLGVAEQVAEQLTQPVS